MQCTMQGTVEGILGESDETIDVLDGMCDKCSVLES